MGRYYSGDIEGKFWFAIQDSKAGEKFGACEIESDHIHYYTEDLEKAEEGIKVIENKLGNKIKILDDFFKNNAFYNKKQIEDLGISQDELSDYADLGLGKQIRDCIKENGYCSFQAEY